MRTRVAGLAAALVLVAGSSPAATLLEGSQDGFSEGGFSSANVEWVGLVPMPGSHEAVRHGDHLYVNSYSQLVILDLGRPLEPAVVGRLSLEPTVIETGATATNGRVLVISRSGSTEGPQHQEPSSDSGGRGMTGRTHVIDVSDKTDPKILDTIEGVSERSWTCILDCSYVYGGLHGNILDLRNPNRARLADDYWIDPIQDGLISLPSSVAEIRPGIVLAGSVPMYLLDARQDPLTPRVLASSDGAPYSHGQVEWPNGGRSPFVISVNDPGYHHPHCDTYKYTDNTRLESLDPALVTWDASHWRQDSFLSPLLDKYRLRNGTLIDGNPPMSTIVPGESGCLPGWFDVHPSFRDHGLIAVGASMHGVKILRILPGGKIEEIGWFLPHGGSSWRSRWITRRIFYSIDHRRGIDILRFNGVLPSNN